MEPIESQQKEAILDFLSECVLEGSIADDSAACFDALAEMYVYNNMIHSPLFVNVFSRSFYRAPGYFATLATSRHDEENWALKQADYKKLLRFMEIFFQMEAKKTTYLLSKVDVAAVAKRDDPHHTLIVLKLVAVAAVLCQRKSIYIQRMMDRLSENAQRILKLVLEETMDCLHDADETTQDETTEPSESQTVEDSKEMVTPVHADKILPAIDMQSPYKKYLQESQERESRIRLLEARLLEQDETMSALTLENNNLRGALQDQTFKVDQLKADNQRLADDIDILRPQVHQLYQSQAEISALKHRVEELSFEKSVHSSQEAKEMSVSLPVSEEDTDVFPCFEDSDASTNPFFSLYEAIKDDDVEKDLSVIPNDVDDYDTVEQLKCQVELLIESQRLKASENESLLRENEKLEAYVKRAMARYQDQYLAAKQDLTCSQSKVKEQQVLIGMLRNRIEQQLASSASISRRRKNKVTATTMKRQIQEYGLGAY